jgi:hypothetical protein
LQKNEYEEQQEISRLALARHPEATGVKDIQPVLMVDTTADAWLVILTTPEASRFITTVVTGEDLKKVQ